MKIRTARAAWTTAVTLFLSVLAVVSFPESNPAQTPEKPKTVPAAQKAPAGATYPKGNPQMRAEDRPARTPQTPFERVIVPGMKRLLAEKNAKGRKAGVKALAEAPVNFGGFVAAPKFQAFDVTDGDTSALTVFAVGDFNKDGKPDVATVQASGAVNVIVNAAPGGRSGTGVNFNAPVTTPSTGIDLSGVSAMVAADVNGDGYDDLILRDGYCNCLDVLINQGNATFGGAYTVATSDVNSLRAFAAADVNGDGTVDVVVASTYVEYDENFNATTTLIFDTYLNDGSGGFATSEGLETTQTVSGYYDVPNGRSVALVDVNGDHKLDMTVQTIHYLDTDSPNEEQTILTLLGAGTGAMQPPNLLATVVIPIESTLNIGFPLVANLNVADINKDGFKDIVFSYQDYSIYAVLGNGDGTYRTPYNVGATEAYPTDLYVADLNGDGMPELVDAEPDFLAIYPPNGDGTFNLPAIKNYGSGMGQFSVLAVADFNGDGLLDPAIMNSYEGSVTVFPTLTSVSAALHAGQLLASGTDYINRVKAQTVLDANGDGYDDIFAWSRGAEGDNPTLVTELGDGKGNFTVVSALPGFAGAAAFDFADSATGDFNGDGKPDIVIHTLDNVWVGLSNGDGTFTPVAVGLGQSFDCSTRYAAIGDVNGDGNQDLVVAYEGDGIYGCNGGSTPSGFFVVLGKGDGTFQAPQFTALGMEVFQPVLVDLNGDGKLDLEVSDVPFDLFGGIFNSFTLMGNGDGTFQTATTILPNWINASTLAGDVNADGKADLVVLMQGLTDPDQGLYYPGLAGANVEFGDGAGNLTDGPVFAQGFFTPGGVLADINGDGKLDLLLSEYSSLDFVDGYAGGIAGIGNGDGTFAGIGNYEGGDSSTTVLLGSFLKDNAPDAAFVSGGSGTTLLIAKGGTTETAVAQPGTIPAGSTATVQVTITPTLAGGAAPSGSVALYEGETQLATTALSEGAANLSVDGLAAGTHVLTAVYSGDANYNPNGTAEATVTVAPPVLVTLSSSASTLTVNSNQTGSVTLTVTGVSGYSGNVSFTTSGAPDGVSVTVNPSSVTLTNGGSATATLTVGATIASGASAAVRWPKPGPWSGGLGALLAMALMALLAAQAKKMPRKLAWAAGIVVLFAAAGAMSGCGGGSGGSSYKGTFALTVTAQPDGAATQTTTIAVTIK